MATFLLWQPFVYCNPVAENRNWPYGWPRPCQPWQAKTVPNSLSVTLQTGYPRAIGNLLFSYCEHDERVKRHQGELFGRWMSTRGQSWSIRSAQHNRGSHVISEKRVGIEKQARAEKMKTCHVVHWEQINKAIWCDTNKVAVSNTWWGHPRVRHPTSSDQ